MQMAEIENKITKPAKGTLTGWHVLFILLGMFGVVFAVNGYFIYQAYHTFSGEEQHAYMEGLKFNETLEARAEQSALGWKMSIALNRGAGGDAQFIAILKDKTGKPIHGATMSGKIGRLVEDKDDQSLAFQESGTAGTYVAHLEALGPGKWEFSATANVSGSPAFATETSLSIR